MLASLTSFRVAVSAFVLIVITGRFLRRGVVGCPR